MSRGRLAVFCVALGAIASQAGHLVAYQLRFGGAAQQLQSAGAHAYFPAVAKTAIGLGAGSVLIALILIGLARLVAGRRLEGDAAPSYLRLVAMLFWIQLACFAVQENLEAAAGAPAPSPGLLLLWGAAGQLPVAMLAGLALCWLAVRIGPAMVRLWGAAAPSLHLAPVTLVQPPVPAPVAVVTRDGIAASFNRRGPPI